MLPKTNKKHDSFLKGQLLMAMPSIGDERFSRAVIFICSHDEKGAMGVVINQTMPDLLFGTLLEDLDIESNITLPTALYKTPVLRGGPVEASRGFLIHSNDFTEKDTVKVQNDIYMTATIDALLSLSKNIVPENFVFALGYAGWQPGQLENEIKDNAWLTLPATTDLVFNTHVDDIWKDSMAHLGINAAQLSSLSGSA